MLESPFSSSVSYLQIFPLINIEFWFCYLRNLKENSVTKGDSEAMLRLFYFQNSWEAKIPGIFMYVNFFLNCLLQKTSPNEMRRKVTL